MLIRAAETEQAMLKQIIKRHGGKEAFQKLLDTI